MSQASQPVSPKRAAFIPEFAEMDAREFGEALNDHNRLMLAYGFNPQDPLFVTVRARIALFVPRD